MQIVSPRKNQRPLLSPEFVAKVGKIKNKRLRRRVLKKAKSNAKFMRQQAYDKAKLSAQGLWKEPNRPPPHRFVSYSEFVAKQAKIVDPLSSESM